jgi:hypothetical protein
MTHEEIHERYRELFNSLKRIISASQSRIINDDPDLLFMDNINYFTKSYLISICTYLEAYLQDLAFVHAEEISERAKAARIPKNYLHWSFNKEMKPKDFAFEDVNISLSKKDIAENLSGNPHKTIVLFRYLGVDLNSDICFSENKDLVGSVVAKRNNIIHHNDEATDISFSDLLYFIDVFLVYMDAIIDGTHKCRVNT